MEGKNGRRLIRASKAGDVLPIKTATLYCWRHRGKFPEIFVQIGRAVCIDLDAFDRVFPTGGTPEPRG